MLNDAFKVEMPVEKIVTRKIKNIEYVYYILRSYRNAKGQPTSDTVLIGKKDANTGMLIPNKKYYSVFEKEPEMSIELSKEKAMPNLVLDYGNNFILDYILEKYDVLSTLRYAFPEDYKEIATLAKYMVCEGNVYYYCEDWCEKTFTGIDKIITSQKSSVICKNIDLKGKSKFFKLWIFAREKEEYLAYDVTSISSYSHGNDSLEWGYNRDGESLPQVNMGMIFGENTKIPVFYNVYPGSIPDKTYLDYMLRDMEELGIKYSKLVMDKGFFSDANLKKLENKTVGFIVSMPNNQIIPKKIIANARGIQYESKYSLGFGKPYAKSMIINDYGFRAKVHVYFDNIKFNDETERLYSNLEKREAALATLESKPTSKADYDKYFIFYENKKDGFSFERNEKLIDETIANFGYFLIMTTDLKLSSGEVLEIYRRKDVVEKCFDNLKNEIDMKRISSHTRESSEGKIFVAFIALILRSVLENTLNSFNRKNNLTIDKVLKELSKIRYVNLTDGTSLLNPITKKQKDILELFSVKPEDVEQSVEKV